MLRRRHVLQAVEIIATLALLLTSGPLSSLSVSLTHGAQGAHGQRAAVGAALATSGNSGSGTGLLHPQAQTQAASQPKPWRPSKPTGSTGTSPSKSSPAGAGQVNDPAAGRKPGEQADLRTATSKTYLDGDSHWTLKIYPWPVHYQDAQGHWQDIDNTVVADSSVSGYALGNKGNSWHVHFAPHAGGLQLMHLQVAGGGTLQETLQGAASAPATANGNRVTYAGVYPGVDLLYGLGMAHLEETLLLHNAQTPTSYTFAYHVPGATATQNAAGNVVFTDAKGKLLLIIGAVQLYEAQADGQMAASGLGTDKVQVTLAGSSPDYTITLTPDHAWLSDPKRAFPVALDPTIGPLSGSDAGGGSGGSMTTDTYDESGNPNLNFYTVNAERIGNANAICNTCTGYGTGVDRSYIKFPVTPPAYSRVLNAQLWLYQTTAAGGANQINVYASEVAWDSTTLTWNNHPTALGYGGTGWASSTYNVWDSFTVTDAVHAWFQGTFAVNGFVLLNANENQGLNLFASDNYGSNLPYLSIQYATDAGEAGGSITQVLPTGNQYQLNGSTFTNNPNVTLVTAPADGATVGEGNSSWTSVNGVGDNGGGHGAKWSVDGAGSQLTADTSTCGSSLCSAQTFFTHTLGNMNAWPTFTAMFKSDLQGAFNFGVVESGSENTRFDLAAPAGGNAFTTIEYSTSGNGTYSTYALNIPFTANTWYYGQVDFPQPDAGEIYVWAAGQPKPTTPSVYWTGISMANPGLNFWEQGDNGANLHHYSVANVTMSQRAAYGQDIGSPGMAGSDYLNSDTWTLLSGGGDIWGSSDQFHFVSQSLAGDGSMSAAIQYSAGGGQYSKMGVMLRDGTAVNATNYYVFYEGNRSLLFVDDRPSAGAATQTLAQLSVTAPVYMQITRSGNTFTTSTSSDGVTWTTLSGSSATLTMSSTVQAGLAATAQSTSAVSVADFTSVKLSGAALAGCQSAWRCSAAGLYDTGTGAWGMQFANDSASNPYSCPAPAGGSWCVGAGRQTGWTLSSGDGQKKVYAKFQDNVGYASGTPALNSSIILDTTPPTASFTGPANGREVRGVVTISATVSDPPAASDGSYSGVNTIQLYAGNALCKTAAPVPGVVSFPVSFQVDTTTWGRGTVPFTLHVTDNVGNSFVSAPLNLIVDNTGQMAYETFATRDLPDNEHSVSVNVGNGNTLITHGDIAIGGRGPTLAISRSYNAIQPANGFFGYGWTSELDEAVSPQSDGSVLYRDPSGGYHVFLPNGSGGYVTPPGLYLTLTKNGDGTYSLSARDQSKTNFQAAAANAWGRVTSVVDRHGSTLGYSYDANNNPTQEQDAAGRQLTITTSGGHVTSISAPGARSYTYSYDGNGNLTDYTAYSGSTASRDTHYAYDSSHRLTAITLGYVSGQGGSADTNVVTQLAYDSENRLTQLLDPLNFDDDISYGAAGTYQTTVQQLKTNGSTTTPTSSPNLYETTVYTATSDGMGTISSIADPVNGAAHPTSYAYDAQGNVTQVTDQNTRVTAYTYDGNGNQLTRTIDPGGSGHLNIQTTWTYDSANNVLTESDPAPQGVNTTHGNVIVTAYTYDSPTAGNATQIVKNYINGGPSDAQTNLTTTYTYDSSGEQLTATHPTTSSTPAVTTKETYDGYSDVTQTIQNYVSGGGSDSQTNVTTSATFDSLGEQLSATDAKGVVSQTVYNIDGTVAETKANYVASDSNNNDCPQTIGTGSSNTTGCANVTTINGYDRLGRLVTTTNPKGIVSKTVYDADGRTTQSIQNYQASDATSNDCSNTTTGCINVTTTTSYDAAGNATLTSDVTGATGSNTSTTTNTTTTFDANNQALEVLQQTQAQGSSSWTTVKDTLTGYDPAGNTISSEVKDGGNNPTTTYSYDAANRKVSELDPPANPGSSDPSDPGLKPNETVYSYDAAGTVTDTKVIHDPQGANTTATETTTTPDALGRPLAKVDAANGSSAAAQTTTYAYDFGGRQTGSTGQAASSNPQTTTTNYDALDRPTTVQHPDGSLESTSYDADGQQLSHSNCGGTQGATGSTTTTYDNVGNAIAQVLANCSGATQSSEGDLYDADGNLTARATTPAGGSTSTAQFSYDALDRPTSLNDATRQYVLDALGNVTSMTVAPSATAPTATSYQASYDTGNRLTALTSYAGALPPLHNYSYSYDQHNNRASITADGTITTYTYDAENELLSSQVGTATPTSYEYDANHNRVKRTSAAGTTSYSYDASDTRLTSLTDASNKVTNFTYDYGHPNEAGNLTQKVYDPSGANQVTAYTYDTTNRLSTVTLPNQTVVAFTYDAKGNRTQKSVTPSGGGATITNDTYQNGLLRYETNGSGQLLATFTYDGSGVPVSVRVGTDPNNSPIYYYVYNGHGDVDALTDSQGNVVASYAYDDWGNLTSASESIPNANGWTNPYRYDGHDRVRYDAETGLYWMSVRAYDPTLGRFISHDPLGRLAGMGMDSEPYVYAGNNPLIHVDPSGMRFVSESGNVDAHMASYARAVHKRQLAGQPLQPRSCSKPGAHPTCTQINTAIGDAQAAQRMFSSGYGLMPNPAQLIQNLGSLNNLLRTLLLPLPPPVPSWVPTWALPAAVAVWTVLMVLWAAVGFLVGAVVGAIAGLIFEVELAGSVFQWEAGQPDAFWESPSALQGFHDKVEYIGGALTVAIAAFAIAGLSMLSNPVTIVGGLAVGAAVAGLIGFAKIVPDMVSAIDGEQRDLGYGG